MRRILALIGLLVASAVTQFAAAAPAAAAPGLVLMTAESALNSATTKEAAAECPNGTRVIGGGGYIEGGSRDVHFFRLQASGSLDTYFAAATEVADGYNFNWRVRAFAICANQPAGLEYVSFNTGSDSSSFKTATATCTGARKVLGLGARTSGGGGEVIIDDMAPNAALTSVTVTAYEHNAAYDGNWSLQAFAVCANQLPGLEFRTDTYTPFDSMDKVIAASCPAGKKVHGVGAKMNGVLGQAFYVGIWPMDDLEAAAVLSLEDHDLYANNWSNSAFVICAF